MTTLQLTAMVYAAIGCGVYFYMLTLSFVSTDAFIRVTGCPPPDIDEEFSTAEQIIAGIVVVLMLPVCIVMWPSVLYFYASRRRRRPQ